MRDLPDLLFHDYDLHGTLENTLQRARQDVEDIPEQQFPVKSLRQICWTNGTLERCPCHYL
jgi:hypothetical protein